jgi:hypothetical protein
MTNKTNSEEASGYNPVGSLKPLAVYNPIDKTKGAVNRVLESSTEKYPVIENYRDENIKKALARAVQEIFKEGEESSELNSLIEEYKSLGITFEFSSDESDKHLGEVLLIGGDFGIFKDSGTIRYYIKKEEEGCFLAGIEKSFDFSGPVELSKRKVYLEIINRLVAYGNTL